MDPEFSCSSFYTYETMASEDTSWRTPTFRQSVVAKIEEAIRRSGMPTSKNSLEMENHVFQKAKSREEYLGFVARLILHVREMNTKKTAGMPGSGGPGGQGMPDPINALQTLARQGSANAQMISHMGGAQGGGPGMNQPNQIMGIPAGAQQAMMQQQQQSPQQGQMSATGLLQTMGHQGRGGGQQVVLGGMQGHQGKLPPGMGMSASQGGSMNSVPPQMQNQLQQQMAHMQQQQQQQQQHQQQQQQLQQQHQQMQQQQLQQQQQQQMQQQMQQRKMVEGIVMGGIVGGPGGSMVSGGAMVGGSGGSMISGAMVGGAGGGGGNMVGGPNANMVGGGMAGSGGAMVPGQGGMMGGSMTVGPGVVGGPQQQFVAVRPGSSTPTQYLRRSPSPSIGQVGGSAGPASAPSPASVHGGSIPSNQMNQMAPSPAMVASPSPQMTPLGGPPGSVGAQRSVGMAPSPSSCLNTPGQPVGGGGPTPSPCNPLEDQAYREKVRQLSKYIEPLRRMIARMGNDDVEKLSKMKKLLEILSNPSKRMPLETLLKCEVVLEKLDLKRNEGCGSGGSVPPLPLPPPLPPPIQISKEHHVFSPLLEAVSNHLNSLVINHTLQRTFGPTMEALFGPEIKMLPPPLKRSKPEDPVNDIPDVLQGEIARLDQRFKVSLDPTQHPGSRSVHLVCWLDDRHLPCVPPISLTVPGEYPSSPPKCELSQQEYGSTPFLATVQKALWSRISKLPSQYSISQLLDTWEMSVRQASSPASQILQQAVSENFSLNSPLLSHQPSSQTVAMGL